MRNGSGTYNLPAGNPVVTGTTISSSTMNSTMTDIATALTGSIAANGETPVTANIPFNNFKLTGVATATVRTDAATLGNIQDGTCNWVAAGGSADAITATYNPAITVLLDGQICYVRAGAANATTTPTFAPSGLTAHTITRTGGQALVAGNIYGAGHELELRYNLANTRWELVNPNLTGTVITATLIGNVTGNVTGNADTVTTATNAINATGSAVVTGVVQSGTNPKFRVTRSSQSISSGVFTKITFNTETFDVGGFFDSVTNNRFQPTVAGYYRVSAWVQGIASNNVITYMYAIITKNAGGFGYSNIWGYSGGTPPIAPFFTCVASDSVYMNGTTDYLEVGVYVESTGTPSVSSAVFSGELVP